VYIHCREGSVLIRKRRGRGDRGVALIEAAIMTPVIFLFLFSIFEFGFAFRDYLAVANSTRDGAREASVAGNVTDADYRTLRAIERASAALPTGAIGRIVIFRATGPTSTIPTACKTSTAASTLAENFCNVYTPSDFHIPKSGFGCDPTPNPLPDPDRHWCPTDRIVSVGSGLDYVGVWMSVQHSYITGLFGSGVTFEDTTILKVEPQEQ